MSHASCCITLLALMGSALRLEAQPLELLAIHPVPHASHVPADTLIALEFDQTVGETSFEEGLRVEGRLGGPLAGTWSGGGTELLQFQPEASFLPGDEIRVTITTQLEALSGETLQHGMSYFFTVRAGPASGLDFAQRPIQGSSSNARDTRFRDADGDGDLDLYTAWEGTPEHICFLENTGSADYCEQQLGANFRTVEMHDIDGDGDLDAFGATGAFDTELNWFENTGTPPYTEHLISLQDPWTLTGGDIDSDGDVDVLAAVLLPDRLFWYANDGAGSFDGGHEIASSFDGGSDSQFLLRELDGDGDMDILAYHRAGFRLVWHENDGFGGFSEHLIDTPADRLRLSTGDLDGDGDLDLVAASQENSPTIGLAWYENDGSMQFSPHPIPCSSEGRLYDADIADLDGDGDMDIVAGGYIFENDGSQQFSEQELAGMSQETGSFANGLDHGDLDEDGDLDLLVLGFETFAWYENLEALELLGTAPVGAATAVPRDGVIELEFDLGLEASTVSSEAIHVLSDFRGELPGTLSLPEPALVRFVPDTPFLPGERIEASINEELRSITGAALANRRGFSFHAMAAEVQDPGFTEHGIAVFADNATGMDLGDLDRDGDLDLVGCSWTEFFWFENGGSGEFTPHPIDLANTATNVLLLDADADGDLDLWLDSDGWNASMLYLNDGFQQFTPEETGLAISRLLDARDLLHDGDPGLLFLSNGNSHPGWLDFACGGFEGHGALPGSSATDVTAMDLDGDGDTDFLTAGMSGPLALENDGYQCFTPRSLGATPALTAVLADLDLDGRPDLAVTENAWTLSWYANLSTADSVQFGPRQEIQLLTAAAQDLLAADLDGDGDMDLAMVGRNSDRLSWCFNRLNEAEADFSPVEYAPCPLDPFLLQAGDLDGDLDLDLVTLSNGEDELIWWENTGTNTALEPRRSRPGSFRLLDPAPNPFNPVTRLSFELAVAGPVKLSVHDTRGRLLRNLVHEALPAGLHERHWDGRGASGQPLASGLYLLSLEQDGQLRTRKLLLLK